MFLRTTGLGCKYVSSRVNSRFISSIPSIQGCIIDGSKSAKEVREIEFGALQTQIDNPSGLVQFERGDLKFLLPTTKQTLRDLFMAERKGCTDTIWPEAAQELVGRKCILSLSQHNPRHKQLRKIMNPFFLEEPLRDRYDIINLYARGFIDSLCTDSDGEYVQIMDKAKQFAFNVVLGVIFGIDIFTDSLSTKMISDYERFSKGLNDLDMTHLNDPNTLLGQGMIHRNIILKDIENMIIKCQELYAENKLDIKSLIYKMIDSKTFEDMDEFKDNILALVLAGFDTSAGSMTNVFYAVDQFLKDDNQFAAQLMEELRINKGENGFDFDYMMSGNTKLDAFVKEIVRWDTVSIQVPKIIIKDTEIGNCPIEKGTIVMLDNYATGKNKNIFGDDSLEFKPERFVDNPPKNTVWYPFGFGSKICIAWKLAYLEMKVITCLILSNKEEYEIELDQRRLEKSTTSPLNFYDVYGRVVVQKSKLV